MSFWAAGAVVLGAGVAAGTSAASASDQKKGAKNAQKAQNKATQLQLDTMAQQGHTGTNLLAPYEQSGSAAQARLDYLLGTATAPKAPNINDFKTKYTSAYGYPMEAVDEKGYAQALTNYMRQIEPYARELGITMPVKPMERQFKNAKGQVNKAAYNKAMREYNANLTQTMTSLGMAPEVADAPKIENFTNKKGKVNNKAYAEAMQRYKNQISTYANALGVDVKELAIGKAPSKKDFTRTINGQTKFNKAGYQAAVQDYETKLAGFKDTLNSKAAEKNKAFQDAYKGYGEKQAGGEYGSLLRDFGQGDYEQEAGYTPFANTEEQWRQNPLYTPIPKTLAELQQTPGYQFREQQGEQAVNRSAAAKGNVLSGATLKALTDYGQGLASTEYKNAWDRGMQANNEAWNRAQQAYNAAFNRFNANKATKYTMLSGQASKGQQAAQAMGQFEQNAAGAQNQIQSAWGDNTASLANYVGQVNAAKTQGIGNAIGGLVGGLGGIFGGGGGLGGGGGGGGIGGGGGSGQLTPSLGGNPTGGWANDLFPNQKPQF